MLFQFDFRHEHFLPSFLSPNKKKKKLNNLENNGDNISDIKKPYIFIPLQVHDDSQVLLLSPYVKNMHDFIDYVYTAIKNKYGKKYDIVVKEHPVDRNRAYDYSLIREKYPDIIWLQEGDLKRILSEAELLIVINSTVGFEGLIFQKPVVTLGHSFYNKKGIVFHAEKKSDIQNKITEAIEVGPDKELIRKFVCFVHDQYCIKGSFKYFDNQTVKNIFLRIESLIS